VNILRHVSFCLPPPLPCALPLGYRPCEPNPDGCGTGEGAACCPTLFLTGDQEKGLVSNPPTQSPPRECPDKMFCHNDYWIPINETIQFTCFLREPKDCGTFGKSCCKKNPKPRPTERNDSYRSEVWTCGADQSGMLVLVGPKGGVTATAMSHMGCAPHALPKGRCSTAATGLLLGAVRASSNTAKHCVVQQDGMVLGWFQGLGFAPSQCCLHGCGWRLGPAVTLQ
jgi:hypothetical protein